LFSVAAGCVCVAVGWGDEFGINATELTSYFIAAAVAVLTAIAATLGDLAESAVKRNAGVKDSGRFLPGHGGVLDRFDSMTFAAPAIFILVTLIPAF
jgi:phosphatidate cytidylyltransferase